MKRIITLAACLLLLAGCLPKTTRCVNPLTYTDIPDNDVIRVGKDYYMVSTTMYFCPGAPIMHSRDLVHWQIVSYIYDCLEDDDVYNLRDGRNAYGQGQWATTLRYHDGEFYALFIANDQRKTYVYHSPDITASNWDRYVIDRPFHDAGLLFDDGRAFVVWGNGDLRLTELEPDLSAVKQGGLDTVIINSPREGYMLRAEGAHFYHIGDWYYVLEIDWPRGGFRTETCWRSRNLTGPYESRTVLAGQFDGRRDGVAQGAIFDTPDGDWYSVMFQDHGAVGRIPTLQRVTWEDGWPILGDNTVPEKEFDVPLRPFGENRVWASDEFDSPVLDLVWQWNHKPLDGGWSLEARPGYMRIAATPAEGIFTARNTLTQRTVGPACESSVKLDISGLEAGAHAGLCAFQSHFGALEVEIGDDGAARVMLLSRDGARALGSLSGTEVWFRIDYDFSGDTARFLWSSDGEQWQDSGFELKMRYTLDFFTGYRSALYCYGSEGRECGYADFDWFHQEVRPEQQLWLFSGQSNMELPIRRCMDVVADDVRDYSCQQLHYLKVPLRYDFEGPRSELPAGRWETLDEPGTAREWGALCYYVGRYLHERTGAEIHMINSSVGGSPIEAWLPENMLPDYALTELEQCRDPEWMAATLHHNAHLYSDWQNRHNALPENSSALWEKIDIFSSDWSMDEGLPVLGSHLLRRSFTLKASQTRGDALLRLGAMRDADSTFVNGHYVGNTTYQYPPRNYSVPAEYLREGDNEVEIHLYAAENPAAFVQDKQYCLETSAGQVSLLDGWEHKAGRRMPRRDAQVFLQYKPAGLYNAMIAPLAGKNFKGVVWYQGESNADRPDNYGELLKKMILSWRRTLGNPALPFYIVELAAYEHSERESAETSGWVRLQDIQRQVCEEMDNVWLIPNRDLGEWNDIHPQDKKTLGERTVNVILNK